MAQANGNGMDSGFIELAQEQLESLEAQLAEVDADILERQGKRSVLVEQLSRLRAVVSPVVTSPNRPRIGVVDVQATRDAVVDLLGREGRPMHYRHDLWPSLAGVGHQVDGKDPANTLLSRIFNDERLRRTAPGVYGLAEWEDGRTSTASERTDPGPRRFTAIEAAEEVLREAGTSLHYTEIDKRTRQAGLWVTKSKTPWSTMGSRIYRHIADRKQQSPFLKLGRGIIGLRGRDEADS